MFHHPGQHAEPVGLANIDHPMKRSDTPKQYADPERRWNGRKTPAAPETERLQIMRVTEPVFEHHWHQPFHSDKQVVLNRCDSERYIGQNP